MATMGPTTIGHVKRLAGNLLRMVRAETGLSQRELAEAAGVPQSTIARIESGTRQPSLPVLARILASVDRQLKISVDPYDSHDDLLDMEDARLTAAERHARHAAQDDFAVRLRPAAQS